jgi:serine protease inhibitor
MLFVLPKDAKNWQSVEKTMSEKTISDWCKSMIREEVDCMIPKMKLNASFDLRNVFKNLGAESPFSSEEADFTNMSNSDLFVSQALQNVRVEIDETGTVASSGTAAVFAPKSAPLESAEVKQFYADRPFWFIIRDTETEAIFFLGRFVGAPGNESQPLTVKAPISTVEAPRMQTVTPTPPVTSPPRPTPTPRPTQPRAGWR